MTTNMVWLKLISNQQLQHNTKIWPKAIWKMFLWHNLDENEHNRDMKKFFLIILCVCFCFMGAGCENETKLRVAHISEMTGALSTNYAIKVILDNDDRMEDKYVDLQIKSSKEEQLLTFGEEMQDQYVICLPKSDYRYNLTYLISRTNGATGEAGYQTYEDFGTKVFCFLRIMMLIWHSELSPDKQKRMKKLKKRFWFWVKIFPKKWRLRSKNTKKGKEQKPWKWK